MHRDKPQIFVRSLYILLSAMCAIDRLRSGVGGSTCPFAAIPRFLRAGKGLRTSIGPSSPMLGLGLRKQNLDHRRSVNSKQGSSRKG